MRSIPAGNAHHADQLPPEFIDLGMGAKLALASTTRAAELPPGTVHPEMGRGHVGTLVLCEVTHLGAYRKLETVAAREVPLRRGALFVGVLAKRYSTHSFFGHVPPDGIPLPSMEDYDLLAVGGIIGRCTSAPQYLGPPTKVRILGGISDGGPGGSLCSTLPSVKRTVEDELRLRSRLILVCGTAAEAGKTTFAANLVHHLAHRQSRRVAVAKLAGTGRLRDLRKLAGAGAVASLDFVDGGLPTTYGVGGDIVVGVARGVLNRLSSFGAEFIVAECGGDIMGAHVDEILTDQQISNGTSALVIVPSDALAAYGAEKLLPQIGIEEPPWFGVPTKNAAAAHWRAERLLRRRMIDASSATDLDFLLSKL